VIVGKMPDQLKLLFFLWTREVLLIWQKLDLVVSPTTVGRHLNLLSTSSKKIGVCWQYERIDVAIARLPPTPLLGGLRKLLADRSLGLITQPEPH
jgi:hypothetical protein